MGGISDCERRTNNRDCQLVLRCHRSAPHFPDMPKEGVSANLNSLTRGISRFAHAMRNKRFEPPGVCHEPICSPFRTSLCSKLDFAHFRRLRAPVFPMLRYSAMGARSPVPVHSPRAPTAAARTSPYHAHPPTPGANDTAGSHQRPRCAQPPSPRPPVFVHRSNKSNLVRSTPAPTPFNRCNHLDTIHRHVADLVLATLPTPFQPTHKAAHLGGVRCVSGSSLSPMF